MCSAARGTTENQALTNSGLQGHMKWKKSSLWAFISQCTSNNRGTYPLQLSKQVDLSPQRLAHSSGKKSSSTLATKELFQHHHQQHFPSASWQRDEKKRNTSLGCWTGWEKNCATKEETLRNSLRGDQFPVTPWRGLDLSAFLYVMWENALQEPLSEAKFRTSLLLFSSSSFLLPWEVALLIWNKWNKGVTGHGQPFAFPTPLCS